MEAKIPRLNAAVFDAMKLKTHPARLALAAR
jgi:hypothetical protein